MDEHKENLNIKEAAKYLNCSVSMLRKLIYNNEIEFFKIGNRYYFNRFILSSWITDRYNNKEIGGYEDDIRRNC